jgi:mono/diheme cytochrome c family protein
MKTTTRRRLPDGNAEERIMRIALILIAVTAVAVGLAVSQEPTLDSTSPSATNAAGEDQAVSRGRYLVHHVAMCVQCHTPRRQDGSLDLDDLLQGATIPVDSPFPGQQWSFAAPALAGLPGGWTEQDVARFLQTGETPGGYAPKPPMPPFRLNAEDAVGIAAYLKSLE